MVKRFHAGNLNDVDNATISDTASENHPSKTKCKYLYIFLADLYQMNLLFSILP